MNEQEQLRVSSSDGAPVKRSYQAPTLSVYGSVALLTRNGTQSCSNDNAVVCAAGNMHDVMVSARTVKENIVRMGTHPLGIGLYLFDYKPEYRERWGSGKQFGVMADEVEMVLPEAVMIHSDGYQMVDYAMLASVSRAIH
ncbi:MAG: tail fiber domain-containing protein [Dokdonella sp.]